MACGFQVIHHRGQGLVDLMCHRRGHLAHDAEARGVQQLGLEVLDASLRLLLLAQIPHEAGKVAGFGDAKLANLKLHREGVAVLA